jgi:hypothetical protein
VAALSELLSQIGSSGVVHSVSAGNEVLTSGQNAGNTAYLASYVQQAKSVALPYGIPVTTVQVGRHGQYQEPA